MTRWRSARWGLGLGAIGGAALAALLVVPLVLWNGPPEALLIYPFLVAIPGAVVGAVVGAIAALLSALVSARRSGAGAAGGTGSPGSSPAPGR
jgi:hypothetical protein